MYSSGHLGSFRSGVPGSSSGLTKHTTLPPISPSPSKSDTVKEDTTRNPFVLPPEAEIFTLRERERQKAKEERARERRLKVHEKSTYASRLNAKTASLRKHALTPDHFGGEGADKEASIHEDTQFVLATTRDRHIEKEDLASYVAKKREMFLVQYSLGAKRDEIKKLEEIAKVGRMGLRLSAESDSAFSFPSLPHRPRRRSSRLQRSIWRKVPPCLMSS